MGRAEATGLITTSIVSPILLNCSFVYSSRDLIYSTSLDYIAANSSKDLQSFPVSQVFMSLQAPARIGRLC